MRALDVGSALIDAVVANQVHRVRAILASSPDSSINEQDADGNTALHLVTNREILIVLLNAGPDLTITNDAGCTAEQMQDNAEFAAILRDFHALRDPSGSDEDDVTEELRLVSLKI